MSKISTYSLADEPLQLSDRLIGTEAPRPNPSPTPLATKNFSLGELLQLFSANFPAATLQAVLNAGNIATQNITLTGTINTTVVKPTNIEDILGSQGANFQFLSKATSGINWVNLPVDNLQAVLNAGNTATQNINLTGNITSTRIIPGNIQDYTTSIGTTGQVLTKSTSGIVWSNLPASTTPGLNDVLLVGNTSLQNANIGELGLWDSANSNYISIGTTDQGVTFNVPSVGEIFVAQNDGISFGNGGLAFIKNDLLTTQRVYQLPNASGTIALTSNIPSAITLTTTGTSGPSTLIGSVLNIPVYTGGSPTIPTLDEVLNEGNTSLLNANIGELGIWDSYNGAYIKIIGGDSVFLFENSASNKILSIESGAFSFFKDNIISANLYTTLLTTSRNFNFPNQSGTLALLSDIPSLTGYVQTTRTISTTSPLQGGGDLSANRTLSILQSGTSQDGYLSLTDWNTFNNKQNSLSGTGIVKSTAGTISYINGTTAEYVRGDGSLATFPTITGGTVTSVGLSMPSAFTVSNSPITSSGTIAVTGAGLASQYVRGDGTLANFPTSTGGGSSFNYYLNGSISQGTFGGDTYYQMSRTPILGAGTNFTRTNGAGNGYIASFITDAGDPSLLNIPGGNWNLEFYFQASSGGGSPQFYGEIYKVSATNVFTLVASGSANPEGITNGTTVDQYFTSIPVPQTSLLITDRIAIRIYVITGGRTITLHTENGNLCEVLTTFSTGLTALNGLTSQVQYLAVGTSGTDFNISSVTDTHTFNLPTASATNRGALSSTDWSTFNGKQNAITLTVTGNSGSSTLAGSTLNIPTYTLAGLGGQPQLNGTGFVKASGTTISYDNTTYYPNPTGTTAQYVRGDGSLATFPTIPGGTVTSVAALTLGTSGTDLSSTVVNSTTTPVITLNVPTASATNRGALSSADWTTFNNKQPAIGYTPLSSANNGLSLSGTIAQLGGTLLQSTTIDGGSSSAYNLTFTNGNFIISNGAGGGGLRGNIILSNNRSIYWGSASGNSISADSVSGGITYYAPPSTGKHFFYSSVRFSDYGSGTKTGTATYNLSVNATGDIIETVIPPTIPTLTSGSVVFSNGTTLAQDNANFFWDDTNNRLGIGTASPGVRFVNSGGAFSSGPTLGSGTVGSQALLSNNGLYGMYSGVSSNGDVWHQVQRNDGNTAFYNLALQPSGGNIYIGTNASIYAVPSKVQILFDGLNEYGINFKTGAAAAIPLSFIANTGTQVGYIIYDTTGTAYTTISDYRLKEDLNPINGLDLISKINVYDYKWKEQDKRSYGVLAHELQEIIPQAVFGQKDGAGMQSVDYSLLVPILIDAIKEQQKQIDELKSRFI